MNKKYFTVIITLTHEFHFCLFATTLMVRKINFIEFLSTSTNNLEVTSLQLLTLSLVRNTRN